MRSGLCHTRLNALDFFQDTSFEDRHICAPLSHIGPEHYNCICGLCVGTNVNENLFCTSEGASQMALEIGH